MRGKPARPVREGAVGKGPEPRAPRRRPTSHRPRRHARTERRRPVVERQTQASSRQHPSTVVSRRLPLLGLGRTPRREHDTTCAKKAADLLPALEFYEAEYQIPTLTDLGYVSLSPAIRHPHKKPNGAALTEQQTTYNKVIRGVHGVAERANALLKETFAALQLVSLSPTRIGAITKAALVLLHLEHGRPIPGGYTT